MSLENDIWAGKKNTLRRARSEARILHNKNPLRAHSIMLSEYLSIFASQSRGKKMLYFLLASWHAVMMLRRQKELSYNQLDVLISFLIKVWEVIPSTLRMDIWLLHLAKREFVLAVKAHGKPHQMALALMSVARVSYTINHFTEVRGPIEQALALENQIRAEAEHPQNLRQLVRIFRKVGEICELLRDTGGAQMYYTKALELAQGEADSPDQAQKVRALLEKLKL